jgi:RNA polymerase sigma-70 factor, ECF subfamily
MFRLPPPVLIRARGKSHRRAGRLVLVPGGVYIPVGEGEEFERLTGPFRDELLAYCYRMLGSVQDAEDQVQETLLRAWRSYGGFEGRSSMRTWLYRIATNACLRALENRGRRPLPSGLGAPAHDADAPLAAARLEVPWLEPFPDAMFGTAPADPAAVVVSRASMRLALIAALQYLPARQRAVLILRDVLQWRAAEVAGLLGITTVAVNSLLQRARAQLELVAPAEDAIREPARPADRDLVGRYAAAFENADLTALVAILREDAVMEMPPLPGWFRGRDAIARFLGAHVLTRSGRFRMIPTVANGQPALASYLRDPGGDYHAHSICVLTVAGTELSRVVSFNDPGLFPAFGFPSLLAAGERETVPCRG